MPLFEVAIVQKPTKRDVEENGAVEKLVYGPKPVVAKDPQAAAVAAVLADKPDVDLAKAEILVRPFA